MGKEESDVSCEGENAGDAPEVLHVVGVIAHELSNRVFAARSNLEFAMETAAESGGQLQADVQEAWEAVASLGSTLRWLAMLQPTRVQMLVEFQIDQVLSPCTRVVRHLLPDATPVSFVAGAPGARCHGDLADLYEVLLKVGSAFVLRTRPRALVLETRAYGGRVEIAMRLVEDLPEDAAAQAVGLSLDEFREGKALERLRGELAFVEPRVLGLRLPLI
jgi:hypothetical protein